jgi:hypothetical protein
MAAAFAQVAPTPVPPTVVKPKPPVAVKPTKTMPPTPASRPTKVAPKPVKVAAPVKPADVPARQPASAFGTARIKAGERDEALW